MRLARAMRVTPVYARIEAGFRERILAGALSPGDRLPSESEIAREHGACRATVQRAMLRLAEGGWVERAPGRGTFVAEPPLTVPIDQQRAQFFEEDVAGQGGTVTFRLLSLGRVPAGPALATALGCPAGAQVLRLERQRLVNGRVACLERRHFSPALRPDFPASALETVPIYELVERHLRRRILRLDVLIRAVVADEALAAGLGVALGAPVMLREHLFIGEAEERLIAGRSYYAEPFAFRYSAVRPAGTG